MVEKNLINALIYMTYGDALGLSNENREEYTDELSSFVYSYNDAIKIQKPRGQYSYITELLLITIKSLVDHAEDFKVTVDYKRFYEELKLWKYYRHGNPSNMVAKLEAVNNYYNSDSYWNDVRGEGISRIIPILLANKNFSAAEVEVYKNILYLNRHPQVLLTALLLARTLYRFIEKGCCPKDILIQELKEYIINFKWQAIDPKSDLPKSYSIQFEKERVQYIMALDRMLLKTNQEKESWDSQAIYIEAINKFYQLQEGLSIIEGNGPPKKEWKEILAITYGLWGICCKECTVDIGEVKDGRFIYSMGQYLYKLRNYKIKRKPYKVPVEKVDIFIFEKQDQVNHPILNFGKVLDKIETGEAIQLYLSTKSGTYTFIKEKRHS